MTELLRDVETPSDAELISRVRGGDVTAYGELFSRHKTAANRLARQLVRGLDSDDLVAEAFAKVLSVLRAGGGPDVAFRAYLLTAVRRLHIDRVRSGQRLQTTDDMTPFDPGVPFKDTAVAGFERGAAAKAFASLPERWQLVLWHLEVEGQKPADIAPLLGMSANSVSALAYRAREGLRQAFLTMHLSDTSDTECCWVNEHLGAFVRRGLAKRDATKLQKHLDGCRRCSAMYLELDDVNSNLAGIIAPLLLGTAAAGYLASSGAGAAVGVVAAFSRVKDVVVANSGAAAAAGMASAVAAAAVVAVVVTQGGGPSRNVVADPPAAATSSRPSGATSSPSSLAGPGTRPAPSASATGPATTAATSPSATVTGGAVTPTDAPTFSLSPLPAQTPAATPTATTSPAPTASAAPSTSPGSPGSPSAPTTTPAGGSASPGDSPTGPATPARVVGHPVLHPDGTVSVTVRHARDTDTVDVTLTSQDTTFRSEVGIAGCTTVSSRHVLCRAEAMLRASAGTRVSRAPRAAASTRGSLAPPAPTVDDLSMRLPLAFPDSMVSDDVDVTVSVRSVTGASASSGSRTFRPARTPRFDSVAPVLGAPVHTLAGDEDRYAVPTTVVLPARVPGLVYTLAAPAHFRAVADSGCTVGAGGRTLRCPRVEDGDRVTLPVAAAGLTTSDQASIRVSPVHRFVDPSPGNNTAALTLRPGADLDLSLRVTSADPLRTGLVTLSGRLTGVRPGLGGVAYTVSPGAGFPPGTAGANPGCSVAGAALTCPVAADGDGGRDVSLAVTAAMPGLAAPVTVSVTPSPPFEAVGIGRPAAVLTLPATRVHDFSLTGLTVADHTLVEGGENDRYTLTAGVGTLPADVRSVAFTVSGGAVFATEQTDRPHLCDVDPLTSGSRVRCGGVASGDQVSLVVDSSLPVSQPLTRQAVVRVLPPDSFDDPYPGDGDATVTLAPGVDLRLGDVTSDASPGQGSSAEVDDNHVVTAALTGVRRGLGSVVYALSGAATLRGVVGAPCTDAGTNAMTCPEPVDGTVRFRVAADRTSSTSGVPVTLSASSPAPFVELAPSDNARDTTLAARPSYDFVMGPLTLSNPAVSGDADLFTVTSTVPVPAEVQQLTFEIDGGTFPAVQTGGCSQVDARSVTCGGLSGAATVALRVASTSTSRHPVVLSVLPPTGYRDLDPSNNRARTSVTPAVDLHVGPLTPADPVPSGGAFQVASVLTGDRSGPVTFELSGAATVKATSCTRTSATRVTCATPSNGQTVRFTLTPTNPLARTPVTVHATAAAGLVELDDRDNSATTALAPDVAISALTQVSSTLLSTVVRVQVIGVPTGVSTVRLHLSGPDVGLTGLRFTAGADGADGEGDVDCYTSSATGGPLTDGVDAMCTGVQSGRNGSFYVDTRVARLPMTSTDATFTVVPVGVDQGSHGANDSRTITVHW